MPRTDPGGAAPRSSSAGVLENAAPLLAGGAAAAALFAWTHDLALLGFDAFPLIASARIESAGDLWGLASERLMDGRYPSVFHRPVVSASFALDHALFGLDARGYQATHALLVGALVAALGAAARRVLGGGVLTVLVACAAVALHSSLVEIVPVPARRADTLCGLFMVLALWAQWTPPSRGRSLRMAAFAAFAAASKETAFLYPLIAGAAALVRHPPVDPSSAVPLGSAAQPSSLAAIESPRSAPRVSNWRARVSATLRECAPVAAGVGLVLAFRLSVLGGLGGHGRGGWAGILDLPDAWLAVAAGGTFPADLVAHLPVPVAGGVVLGAWVLWLVRAEAGDTEPRAARRRALGWIGFAWLLVIAAAYALSGWIGAWYWLLPAVGFAFGLAALTDRALADAQRRSSRVRGLAAGLVVAALLAAHASRSPLLRSYDEWTRGSLAQQAFLADLEARLRVAPDGSVVVAPSLPVWVQPRARSGARVRGAAVLSDYSVQAWADLVFPARRVRVLGIEGGVLAREPRGARAGEVVVALDAIAPGF